MSPNRTPRALSRGLECCSLTQKNRAGTAEVLESRPLGGCHPPPHPQTVSGQTKPGRPGRRSQVSVAGRRSYPGLVQGAAASPGLGCRAAGRARLGGAGPRGDEMAAAAGRPRLRSGPRPRPGPRRLGPEKAQRALPGVHHGPDRGPGPRRARRSRERRGRPARRQAVRASGASPGRLALPLWDAGHDKQERGRSQRQREEAGSGRRKRGCRPAAQTQLLLSRPQREPSGAAMSAPFSLVLPLSPSLSLARSLSLSRAPCVRAQAPQGRQGRFRPRPLRGAARTRSPSFSAASVGSAHP